MTDNTYTLLERAYNLISHLEALNIDTQKQKENLMHMLRSELTGPTRCALCGYQHGHQIGCANNPVDIALSRQALRAALAAPATAPEVGPERPSWDYERLDRLLSTCLSGKAYEDYLNSLKRVAKIATAPEPCKWRLDDDESNTWESGCGELWTYIDGSPTENRVKYCHGCGKPVELEDKP